MAHGGRLPSTIRSGSCAAKLMALAAVLLLILAVPPPANARGLVNSATRTAGFDLGASTEHPEQHEQDVATSSGRTLLAKASPSPSPSPKPSPSPSPKPSPSPSPKPSPSPSPSPAISVLAVPEDDGPGPADGNNKTVGDGSIAFPVVPNSDPNTYGQWILKAVGNVVAVHMCQIPGSDKFFFMERPSGRHPDGSNNIAGYYDYSTNKFKNVNYTDSVFCAGHTVTQDGHVLVVGGHIAKAGYGDGLKGVRIFSRKTLTFHRIANMTFPRWYPTATLLPDGQVTIMGGTVLPGAGTGKNPIYEIWNPANPTQLAKRNQSAAMVAKTNDIYYPNTYVLPTGDLFIFCNRYGEITQPLTGTVRATVPSWSNVAKGVFTEYPFTGTSAMLALTPENNYTPEVVYFGGQFSYGWINTTASKLALRIKVLYDDATGNYTFEGWTAEKMPLPRVMGDAIVLPNGKVVVLNGATKGLAGDSASGGVAKANEPALWPIMYDPAAPLGSRMTAMTRSSIPRMYHSTVSLTTDGSLLVGGCDRCDKFWWTTPGGISKSPTSFAEYRIEVFRPPCWFNVTAKPQIEVIDSSTWDEEDQVNVMQYDGTPFALEYSLFYETDAVTSAVLVSPSSTTHSTNMNQRVVGLQILQQDTVARRLILAGPPNINIAPPGWYMLFLLNGDVYGQSAWVRLPGSAPRLDSLIASMAAPAKK